MAFKSFEKERKKSSRLPEAISFDVLNVQEGIRVVFLTLLKQIVNYWMTWKSIDNNLKLYEKNLDELKMTYLAFYYRSNYYKLKLQCIFNFFVYGWQLRVLLFEKTL